MFLEPRQLFAEAQTPHRNAHVKTPVVKPGFQEFPVRFSSQNYNEINPVKMPFKVSQNFARPQTQLELRHLVQCLVVGFDDPFRRKKSVLRRQYKPRPARAFHIGAGLSEPVGRVEKFRGHTSRALSAHTRNQVKNGLVAPRPVCFRT